MAMKRRKQSVNLFGCCLALLAGLALVVIALITAIVLGPFFIAVGLIVFTGFLLAGMVASAMFGGKQ
jgi:hypothetical protein